MAGASQTNSVVDLSICIVSWKVKDLLKNCLDSIYQQKWKIKLEVFVVDNNSQDGTVEMISQKFPQVNLTANTHNLGFTKTNNQVIRRSQGKYVLLLNPDTLVHKDSLDKAVEFMREHPLAGVLGIKLLNRDGSLQRSILSFPTLRALIYRNLFIEYLFPRNKTSAKYLQLDFDYSQTGQVDQPMGAALFVSRSAFEEAGLMDENINMFFDGVDWCYRIKKAGWEIYYYPEAQITHLGGQSLKKWNPLKLSRVWNKSRDYFFKKHFGIWAVFWLHLSDLGRVIISICLLLTGLYLIFLIL